VEPAGGWRWITSEPFTFTAWHPGEPNDGNPTISEGVLQFYGHARTWNDISDYPDRFIVEFEPQTPDLREVTVAGDSAIPAGSLRTYRCMASYSDGTVQDVSAQAQWTVLQPAPPGTVFSGASLIASPIVTVSTPITIRAQFTAIPLPDQKSVGSTL
jgi:hypothetical protein